MAFNIADIELAPGEELPDAAALSVLSYTTLGDRLVYTPRVLPRMVIDAIAVTVQTTPGSAGSLIRLGLFNVVAPTRLIPGNLIIDAGTISGETAVVKRIVIPPFIWPGGPLFVGFASQGAPVTGPTMSVTTSLEIPTVQPDNTTVANKWYAQLAVAGAFPAVAAPNSSIGLGIYSLIRAGNIRDVRPA